LYDSELVRKHKQKTNSVFPKIVHKSY